MGGTLTFDGEPPAGTIHLGLGQPSADLLPLELLHRASESFFVQADPIELNYGSLPGDERFLRSLAAFVGRAYGAPADPNSFVVTGGVSQALDLVSTVFAQPGDTVFVEEPSYFLAFKILRDHGLNVVGVPIDDEGLRVDVLEDLLGRHRPAFLYTIPTHHNPGGQCLNEERRRRILELSQRDGFLIIADEVYHLLSYATTPPPAFGTMVESDRVVSLGSFSKILAPGLRLGWIQAGPQLRQRVLANGLINSGGSLNHWVSHVVRQALESGLQQEHVSELQGAFSRRLAAMDRTLHELFGDIATWQRPAGGYFFWLQLEESVDTSVLLERAKQRATAFQPGVSFSCEGGLRNCLRLSFAHYSEVDIRCGLERLRAAF